MANLTNQAIHDYLKTIFEICEQDGRASTGRIADGLGVTPASVTGMLKKLASTEPPLLSYRKHHGVVLTGEGEQKALQIIRRHRLLECFLHDALGYSWDEVHEEAERLEHAISRELGGKIAELLDDPQRDPHGAPIPDCELQLPKDHAVPLDTLKAGCRAIVQRVCDRDSQLLRYLAEVGLMPGAELSVMAPLPFSDRVRLWCGEDREPLSISRRVASNIFVEEIASLEEKVPQTSLSAGESLR